MNRQGAKTKLAALSAARLATGAGAALDEDLSPLAPPCTTFWSRKLTPDSSQL